MLVLIAPLTAPRLACTAVLRGADAWGAEAGGAGARGRAGSCWWAFLRPSGPRTPTSRPRADASPLCSSYDAACLMERQESCFRESVEHSTPYRELGVRAEPAAPRARRRGAGAMALYTSG